MLKQRLLVALVFLPIFICLIFWSNPFPLYGLVWAGLILAALELGKLIEHRGIKFHWGIAVPVIVAMGVMAAMAPEGLRWGPLVITLPVIFMAGFLAVCMQEVFRGDTDLGFTGIGTTTFALLMLGGIGSFFPRLRQLPHGAWWFALLFGMNWIYDAGAYFSGRWFGRTKLIPRISPGKTVEGFIGGLIINAMISGIAYAAFLPQGMGFSLPGIMLLAVIMGMLAQAGDLVESLIKRWSGSKDSAGFIPGHGGVLDKVDSAFFTAPVLYYVARWLMGL
jgi:phosphatidate cytidylyltransferase